MIMLNITETYNEEGILSDRLDTVLINKENLLGKLLNLARQASQIKENQQLVVSFPQDNTEEISVEIYNGYRE